MLDRSSEGNAHGPMLEMLRSYTTLARTLNLSEAVRMLGTTRQTVRRHVQLLEDARGTALFEVRERRYYLTAAGEAALLEAEDIIARADAWLKLGAGHRDGLFRLQGRLEGGGMYLMQQLPLSKVWDCAAPVMTDALSRWISCRGRLAHPEFEQVREHAIVIRRNHSDWICAEIGPKSEFAFYHGWDAARSSVGRAMQELPGGPSSVRMMAQPLAEVEATQSVRYDHVMSPMSRSAQPGTPHAEPELIPFERLLFGCRYPDNSPVVVSVVKRFENAEESVFAGQLPA